MSDDILRKLVRAKIAEEIVAIIDEAGGVIELDDAKAYLNYRNRRTLTEEDLELVAGGMGEIFLIDPDGRYVFNHRLFR
ncbi:MAG: hypothetical protein LBL98_06350 [Ruminococcus sp.]|jgi:hypothetical protein|nr:hypothetical protein [Ruminococcus sp.]